MIQVSFCSFNYFCQPPGAGAFSGDFTTNLARQCRAFSRALKIEKLKAPLFPGPEGAGATNDWCIKWVLRKRRYTENLLLKYVVRRVILVYRPHSLEGRDLSFCMPVQRRDSPKGLSWFGRLNQVLETTTMR